MAFVTEQQATVLIVTLGFAIIDSTYWTLLVLNHRRFKDYEAEARDDLK